jgi:hypothetical protein
MSIYFVSGKNAINDFDLWKDIHVITPELLLSKETNALNKANGLIINCELDEDEKGERKECVRFYGIQMARELRLRGVTVPMVFTSFLTPGMMIKHAQYGVLLKAIGHEFVRLPANPQHMIDKLQQMNALSPLELRDVQLFSCQSEGIVRTKRHQIPSLTNQFISGTISASLAKAELESWIGEMHKVFGSDESTDLEAFKKEFIDLTADNIDLAGSYIKRVGEQLMKKYQPDANELNIHHQERKPWKVLMLDDELTENSLLVELIKQKGGDVICTTTAEEARIALEEDDEYRGKICLLLCDYRLFETRDGIGEYYQKTQGYSFLHHVGERFQSRLLSAVVYSGLPRQFLMESFKSFKTRTEIYSKIDFDMNDGKAMSFLASRILELGDENYEAMMTLPLNNAGWARHIHKWYVYYRSRSDYELREREISDYCANWIHDFKMGDNPLTPLGKGEEIKDDVGGGGSDNYCLSCAKYLIPRDESLIAIRLSRFEEIFKARRIAQYLYLYFLYLNERDKGQGPKIDVFKEVFNAIKPPNRKSEDESSRKRLLNVILGLSLTEFPLNATIEEINWFHYDMGFPLLEGYKKVKSKLNETEEMIATIVNEFPFLKERIVQGDYVIMSFREKGPANRTNGIEITNEVLFNSNSFKPYLFDKIDAGLVNNWLREQFEDRGADEMRYFIEDYSIKLEGLWKWRI